MASQRIVIVLASVAAVACGLQAYYLRMQAIWGAPIYWEHDAALIGSAVLLVGAFAHLINRIAGAVLSTAGLTALWLFYGPALANTVPKVELGRTRLAELVLGFGPSLLLVAASLLLLFHWIRGYRASTSFSEAT